MPYTPSTCAIDPLISCLELAHKTSEAGFESGLLRLSHHQKRNVVDLQKKETELQDELRRKQSNSSWWQKVANVVSTIFIAIGIVAGIVAAAAGSTVVAIALITACIWRIGSEVIHALNLKQKILDAIVPQELTNRKKICQIIELSAQVLDIASQIIVAIGSGWVGVTQLTGQAQNVFQLATILATATQTGVSTTAAIKQAQANYLQGDVIEHSAKRNKAEREADAMRRDLERSADNLNQLAKISSHVLEANHKAKEDILVNTDN